MNVFVYDKRVTIRLLMALSRAKGVIVAVAGEYKWEWMQPEIEAINAALEKGFAEFPEDAQGPAQTVNEGENDG